MPPPLLHRYITVTPPKAEDLLRPPPLHYRYVTVTLPVHYRHTSQGGEPAPPPAHRYWYLCQKTCAFAFKRNEISLVWEWPAVGAVGAVGPLAPHQWEQCRAVLKRRETGRHHTDPGKRLPNNSAV